MSKHTPGPWFLWDTDGTDFTAIATVPRAGEKMDIDHEVLGSSEWMRWEDADARLIAAAPDLLRALKLALPALGALETFDVARDAIEKAEGK